MGEGDLDMKNRDILLILHNIARLRSLEIMLMYWREEGYHVVMGEGVSVPSPKKNFFWTFKNLFGV